MSKGGNMQEGILATALLARLRGDNNGVPAAALLADALIEKAAAGDARAFEIIRNTIGENPKDKQSEQPLKTEIKWTGQ